MRRLFASMAYLPSGWARNVMIEIDDAGDIISATANSPHNAADEILTGPALPGMANLHSHAFQRAMAGLTERHQNSGGDFWSWRQVMYRSLESLTPEDVQAIAAQLYVEMLEAGYTSVAEFHYLHHAPDGGAYDDPAETSMRIFAAADQTGIALTHLPVLYRYGLFGGGDAEPGQRRFLNDSDAFAYLVERMKPAIGAQPDHILGAAAHSLRAISPELLVDLAGLLPDAPLHIHIAEQTREVEECLAWSGKRPVEWLLENHELDSRWCLVHATHMTDAETKALAKSGAIAGLCPTTEANLGDGLYPFESFQAACGAFGIGSDSHVSIDPFEELRLLDYGQRLIHRRRAVDPRPGSAGQHLYDAALRGGAQACGRATGAIAPGQRADLLVLDPNNPAIAEQGPETLLDALIFAPRGNPVADVMVGGQWRVRGGRHPHREPIFNAYRKTVKGLISRL
jgi:formimidoylglutamate deiminase